jgi:hypothetical protein
MSTVVLAGSPLPLTVTVEPGVVCEGLTVTEGDDVDVVDGHPDATVVEVVDVDGVEVLEVDVLEVVEVLEVDVLDDVDDVVELEAEVEVVVEDEEVLLDEEEVLVDEEADVDEVVTALGVSLATLFVFCSVNQMLPSGPDAMK